MKDLISEAEKNLKKRNEYFFENGFEKAHTVVFFIDRKRRRIAMLKRSPLASFAPSLYTGVGGKIEKGEGHRDGAMRELEEELIEREDGFKKENIEEFGRIIINGRGIISYFYIPYESDDLPETSEDIGELEWVSLDSVMNIEIIPTTRVFMEEWKRRGWEVDAPFTVLMTREDPNDVNSRISSVEVREELVSSMA